MAKQPNYAQLLLTFFLIFTHVLARPLNNQNHLQDDETLPRPIQRNIEAFKAFQVSVKNSGPSPGEGHSHQNGLHN